ncbi:hypothetical protein ELI03_08650 [Rhizobium leguminosarum]|uniref:Uncharacterized protein n=1 Tax=Rhizobium leguminosarum TaxID=384 RepID=A0A4Q8XXZ4_RHILE|nr:hypothetical protein ELI03_08650 [Rhizobium leguminosarum]
MHNGKNVPLNEIGLLGSAAKISQPIFITTHPADQKAGDHDRQTHQVHAFPCGHHLRAHR